MKKILALGLFLGVMIFAVHALTAEAAVDATSGIAGTVTWRAEPGSALAAGAEIVRGLLAEVVDYREAYRALDAESQKTLDYLTALDVSAFRTVREGGRRMQI